ncbi:5-hydroxytryptamine receptor 4-like [Acanthaster planci]|uniref:5-hydroxytryptamine receptor 4-like n=1 Tax=Acanthaster planci TaxID=133434 RepID=A0A8B7XMP3_ACAPL|nr:5-hydroxytryptamine receptor 4-like [Acanthaster planci]
MAFSANSTFASVAETLYTYPELVFVTVGASILITVTLVGNSLVLVAVARTKTLQNVTNVFLVNLSVADCLLSFAMLWSVPGLVSKTPGYPLESDIPCVTAAGLLFIATGCSVFTLANIAVNRFILITRRRTTYQRLYTPRKIALMVLASWLVPMCAVVIPPLFGIGGLGFDLESRGCQQLTTLPKAAVYTKIRTAVFYPVPFIVIIVSYALIWRHVRRHFKKRQQPGISLQSTAESAVGTLACSTSLRLGGVDEPDFSSISGPSMSSRRAKRRRHLNSVKRDHLAITKNLLVVVVAFIICFTPIAIMAFTGSKRYYLYGALILLVHGCITPFIYAAKHPYFKPTLRSMTRCLCSKLQEV